MDAQVLTSQAQAIATVFSTLVSIVLLLLGLGALFISWRENALYAEQWAVPVRSNAWEKCQEKLDTLDRLSEVITSLLIGIPTVIILLYVYVKIFR